jgi:hypothetical protein
MRLEKREIARNAAEGRPPRGPPAKSSIIRTTPEPFGGSMGHPSGGQRDGNSFVASPSRECASGPGSCASRQTFSPVLVGASPEAPGARKIAASVHGTFAARRRYDCACGYSSTAPESIAKHCDHPQPRPRAAGIMQSEASEK